MPTHEVHDDTGLGSCNPPPGTPLTAAEAAAFRHEQWQEANRLSRLGCTEEEIARALGLGNLASDGQQSESRDPQPRLLEGLKSLY